MLSSIDKSSCVRSFGGIDQWDETFSQSIRTKLENHWRSKLSWDGFAENDCHNKFYVLSMFPYPSGLLHMGHIRVYSISDVIARYYRMKGKNVIHPIGWDAFGLPAENAAYEKGVDPEVWTQENIANMKSLMEEMNFSFDWDREFATCDSDYYRWTQFLFLKLYENGLVYRKNALVNWDPVDKTVLADEQVDDDGRSWRSGALVEKKALRQWFIKTTAFSESLSKSLEDPALKSWGDVIKIQKNWIGKVNGTTLHFEVINEIPEGKEKVMAIWLQNPEQIYKAKFVAVKPKSFWSFGCDAPCLMPFAVKNPFTGDILPVYLTDSIIFPENTDTYLGIPEIIDQDRNFANSVKLAYSQKDQILAEGEELLKLKENICAEARARGLGGYSTSSNLKDWLISRQRYWGTPIPIVYCSRCGEQPVPETELPVQLPKLKCLTKGKNPLLEAKDWYETTCPVCGGEATRETDTMDTFVDSSWYYLRYLDPNNGDAAFSVDKVRQLMPIDVYIGGKEHAALHLFYTRFMYHFLYSVGLVPSREPFKELLCQGMVKGMTYKNKKTSEYVKACMVEHKNGNFIHKETKEELSMDWEKMSKSKQNSVDPRALLSKYGVDTTRLVVLSGPGPKSELNWDEKRFHDILLWQSRLWVIVKNFIKCRKNPLLEFQETEEYKNVDYYLYDSRNFFLKAMIRSIERHFNIALAISKLQGLTNSLNKAKVDVITHSLQYERALALLIILLAPIAPYFASELWAGFMKAQNRLCVCGEILWDRPVFNQPWPAVDHDYKPEAKDLLKLFVRKTKTPEKKQRKKNKKPRKVVI